MGFDYAQLDQGRPELVHEEQRCLEILEKKGCNESSLNAMKIKPNDSQNKRHLPETVMGYQEFLKLGVYKTYTRDLLDKRTSYLQRF